MKLKITMLIVLTIGLIVLAVPLFNRFMLDEARRADANRLCYGWTKDTEPTRAQCVADYMGYYQ